MKSSTSPVMLTDMLHKFDESKRAVANLMARENITVQVVSGADTAKFNPTTRVLIVPNWVGLTVEQCDLLMSHEIGHALFTDRKMDLSKISKGLFTYLNIIEDARIERKMKAAFPGIGPTFFKGYREFHANGPILKGTTDSLINPKTNEDVKIASMKLIDRINLYYKIGAFAKCPISADEAKWIARIDRATSTDDCLAIARDMHREQKESDKKPQPKNNPSHKPEKQPKQGQTEQGDDQDGDQESSSGAKQDDSKEKDAKDQDAKGDEDGAEGDEDGDDQGSNSDGDEDGDEDGDDSEAAGDESDEDADEKADAPSKGDDQDGDDQDGDKPAPADEPTTPSDGTSDEDSDPSADTSDMTEEALKDIASKTPGESPVVHIVYPVLTDEVMKNRTITARAWTLDALEAITAANGTEADLDTLEADWNSKYLATAKHMALEFERRKMAKQMIASTTAKSGKLDLSKLAQYRFTDDLFKRSVNVPNGKSHGVVMLIDGSGSMAGVFANVIDQTLLFAHFAYQVNIPFEAYMFSDVTSWKIDANGNREGHFNQISQGINTLTLNETGVLVGLVNTTADRTMFKKNVRALLAVRARYDRSRCLSAETSRGIDNIPYSGLNGTPLFNGVMIAERHLARMKQQQRLDKTTFIVITDGEDTAGLTYESNDRPKYASTTDGPHFADLNGPFVVRDAVTKKNLTFVRTAKNYNGIETAYQPHNAVLTMLLDIIKLRHDSRNVYIYLQPGGRRSSYRRYYRGNVRRNNYSTDGLNYLVRTGKEDLAAQLDRSAILESLKTDGQYVLPVTVGVADLAIMLPVGSVMLTENEFKGLDTSDLTQKKIAAEFTKSMVKAVSNRKFVNSIVPFLI